MSTTTRTAAPASERQLGFLRSLYAERDITGIDSPDWDTVTAKQAHNLIDVLITRPRIVAGSTVVVAEVSPFPAGFYAVSVPGDAQELAFFELDIPTEGRWAGRVFLSQLASDNRWPVKGARRATVMALIAEDYKAAGARFGQTIGRCCRCHRTLTDERTRAAGIGDDCAGKF